MQRVLILGIGNTLLGDEGFGVHAMRHLQANYDWPQNFRLLDGGTLGLLLLGELFECDLAIILDIARGGREPGTIYCLEDDALKKSLAICQSSHQTSIEDVLISCELAGHRPRVLIYALEPYDFSSVSAELTPEAAGKLPDFCAKVRRDLTERGILPA